MAYFVGMLIGGVLITYVFYFIWEAALFKRVMNDPAWGKLASTAAGSLTMLAFAILTDSASTARVSALAISFLIVGAFTYQRGLRLRHQDPEVSEVFE